jgi:hypothetical protein
MRLKVNKSNKYYIYILMQEFDEIEYIFYARALALSFFFVYIAMKNAPPPIAHPSPPSPPSHPSASLDQPNSSNVLSKLIENGATFYGASWCGYTKKQLAELDITETNTKGLDYVDCDNQDELCASKGIEAFPTWQINGQIYPGYYSQDKLSELLTN